MFIVELSEMFFWSEKYWWTNEKFYSSIKRPSQHINDLILIHVHVYNSKLKTTIEILKHGFYIIIYIIHVEANDNNNNIPGSIL